MARYGDKLRGFKDTAKRLEEAAKEMVEDTTITIDEVKQQELMLRAQAVKEVTASIEMKEQEKMDDVNKKHDDDNDDNNKSDDNVNDLASNEPTSSVSVTTACVGSTPLDDSESEESSLSDTDTDTETDSVQKSMIQTRAEKKDDTTETKIPSSDNHHRNDDSSHHNIAGVSSNRSQAGAVHVRARKFGELTLFEQCCVNKRLGPPRMQSCKPDNRRYIFDSVLGVVRDDTGTIIEKSITANQVWKEQQLRTYLERKGKPTAETDHSYQQTYQKINNKSRLYKVTPTEAEMTLASTSTTTST